MSGSIYTSNQLVDDRSAAYQWLGLSIHPPFLQLIINVRVLYPIAISLHALDRHRLPLGVDIGPRTLVRVRSGGVGVGVRASRYGPVHPSTVSGDCQLHSHLIEEPPAQPALALDCARQRCEGGAQIGERRLLLRPIGIWCICSSTCTSICAAVVLLLLLKATCKLIVHILECLGKERVVAEQVIEHAVRVGIRVSSSAKGGGGCRNCARSPRRNRAVRIDAHSPGQEVVVLFPASLIAQHLVGTTNLLKFDLALLLIGIDIPIGMVPQREATVGLANVEGRDLGGWLGRELEDVVVGWIFPWCFACACVGRRHGLAWPPSRTFGCARPCVLFECNDTQ
mmetsp:Transcript_30433/g.71258  ORF Transcript_30433/g.71258 Transcript_30433/m.71258 type:complete len:339 (+) Transcript_30433:168-1184(+)